MKSVKLFLKNACCTYAMNSLQYLGPSCFLYVCNISTTIMWPQDLVWLGGTRVYLKTARLPLSACSKWLTIN